MVVLGELMQTFLPFASFKQSARCLDYRRLGKQRSEARMIIDILEGRGKISKTGKVAWINHPAVKMWKGYEGALKAYYNTVLTEWIRRGYKNGMEIAYIDRNISFPPWLGDDRLHSSHRSNLLRKNFAFYGKFNWEEDPEQPYFWPTKEEECYGKARLAHQ